MQEYLDRRGVVARANSRGIPLKTGTLEKDCARGRGPKVAATYGGHKLELYTLASADAYIDSKITPAMTEAAE
jgi:hypothetical protein